MGGKVPNWIFAALILGLLEAGEFFYNRLSYKLPGQILALCAIVLAVVWIVIIGIRLIMRKK